MNAAGLFANEAWLEQHLGAAEALAANSDDIAIGKLVSFLLVRTFAGRLHFCVEVQGNIAELLLDITHDLTLSCCGERIAALCENLHEILCEITASEVKTEGCHVAKHTLHRLAQYGRHRRQSPSQYLWCGLRHTMKAQPGWPHTWQEH